MGSGRTLQCLLLASVALFSLSAAQIISGEDVCLSSEDSENVTFTCTSNGDEIVWRVATRQLLDPENFASEGILVNASAFTSTILLTQDGREFVTDQIGQNEFFVTCLVVRNFLGLIEGQSRRVISYSAPMAPEGLTLTPMITGQEQEYRIDWTRSVEEDICISIVFRIFVIRISPDGTMETVHTTGVSLDQSDDGINFSEEYTDSSTDCLLHEFEVCSVTDVNSTCVTIEETIPISPDVGPITDSLSVWPVLTEGVEISVTFEPATTCSSTNYPIINYTITVMDLEGSLTVSPSDTTITAVLNNSHFPEITASTYNIVVMACISIACQQAEPVSVVTSGVQSANITFLNTTVSLECDFAETSSAEGCRFVLSLVDGSSEVMDLPRSTDGNATQDCAETNNRMEAYVSISVFTIEEGGSQGSYALIPVIGVTDSEDGFPCELPTPPVEIDIRQETTLSAGEIAAIIIFVLVIFIAVIVGLVICVWWRNKTIRNAFKDWVHPIEEGDGINLMMREEINKKTTLMMLFDNLIPGPASKTTTLQKKREDNKVTPWYDSIDASGNIATRVSEDEVALKERERSSTPPAYTGKEPVASIKFQDPNNTQSLRLMLKPAMLAKVVHVWKSKIHRGSDELMLYCKLDEQEEVDDDDEPYWEDREDAVSQN